MAEGRTEETWNHTAALLAMLVNVNRDPKKGRPSKPADFHPHHQRRTKPMKADLRVLKKVFVEGR